MLAPNLLTGQPIIAPPKLDTPIVFDGVLNEPFWDKLEPLEMTMYLPIYRGEKSERDEVYLVYDNDYIYLAGRLYYNNMDDVRSNSLYRDKYSSDDTFALILDTFNDNENAVWFYTTPDGNRSESLVSEDGKSVNSDWDTFWDVRTHRTEWGWSVELRVPFSSLNFQVENDEAFMGVTIYRFLSKRNERYIFPAIPPNWSDGFQMPSNAQKIKLHGIKSENPIYFAPYLLGGFKQTSNLNTAIPRYETKQDWTKEAGLDIKLNVTNNLTLDLTANTDFAQVEADHQQINLTRFPLFFPEKRQFFQERSSLFDFEFTMGNRLFHSRRIGLSSTGEPIRIYGGARAVGKFGDTDIGFINMQTAPSANLPTENFNVIRVKRRIFNEYSTLGGMFTSRVGNYQTGVNNFAYGVDANVRAFGDEYITLKLAQTFNANQNDLLENSRLYAQWDRRKNVGFSYQIRFDRTGSMFNPEMGFIMRKNFTLLENHSGYKWVTEKSPVLRDYALHNMVNVYYRNTDKQVESAVFNPHLHIDTKAGTSYLIQTSYRYESLVMPFTVSSKNNVVVPAGDYHYQDFEFSYNAPNGWALRPNIGGNMGGFFDGTRVTLRMGIKWYPSKHFELGNDYEFNNVRFKNRNQHFEAHIARINSRISLNTKISLTTFAQYNSEADKIGINARFRYNFAQGDDFWVVYDNLVNTERDQFGLPRMPLSGYQAVLVKFTRTFKY